MVLHDLVDLVDGEVEWKKERSIELSSKPGVDLLHDGIPTKTSGRPKNLAKTISDIRA